jgi:hypothetical protein
VLIDWGIGDRLNGNLSIGGLTNQPSQALIIRGSSGGSTYTLSAAYTLYSLTGYSAKLLKGYKVTASQGAYTSPVTPQLYIPLEK